MKNKSSIKKNSLSSRSSLKLSNNINLPPDLKITKTVK
jgi:hypothetical protein